MITGKWKTCKQYYQSRKYLLYTVLFFANYIFPFTFLNIFSAKPVFTTGAGFTAQRQAAAPKAPTAVQVTTTSSTYTYPPSSTPAVNTYSAAYNAPTTTHANLTGTTGVLHFTIDAMKLVYYLLPVDK